MSVIPLCFVHGSFTPSCLHTIIPIAPWHAHPACSTPACLSLFLILLAMAESARPQCQISSVFCALHLCVISFAPPPTTTPCLKAFNTGCHVASLNARAGKVQKWGAKEKQQQQQTKRCKEGVCEPDGHVRLAWCRPDVDEYVERDGEEGEREGMGEG